MPPTLESEVLLARQRRVALDRLGEDLLGLGRAAPAVELDPLALLQVLVVLEEVADALEPVRADLGDVVDVAVAGEHLVDRNRKDLLGAARSEVHTSELQSLMRIQFAVSCLK